MQALSRGRSPCGVARCCARTFLLPFGPRLLGGLRRRLFRGLGLRGGLRLLLGLGRHLWGVVEGGGEGRERCGSVGKAGPRGRSDSDVHFFPHFFPAFIPALRTPPSPQVPLTPASKDVGTRQGESATLALKKARSMRRADPLKPQNPPTQREPVRRVSRYLSSRSPPVAFAGQVR